MGKVELGDSFQRIRRAVVVCAHTDDEFGCAGSLFRLIRGGTEVRYVAFSRCEESVPSGFAKDILESECRESTQRLGLASDHVEINRFRVRYFPEHRQEILDYLYRLQQNFRPDLVFLPASFDHHQDHGTVYAEGVRAFRNCTILGYELPQNNISFENSAFVTLSEEELSGKIQALSAYRSQAFRPYASADYIRSLAKVRGVQCGADFAEAFEAIRIIWK